MLSRCADIRYYLTRDAFRCSLLDFVDPDIGVTRKYGWSIMIQVEHDIRSLIISLVQNSTIIFVSEKKKKKKSTYIIYIYIYMSGSRTKSKNRDIRASNVSNRSPTTSLCNFALISRGENVIPPSLDANRERNLSIYYRRPGTAFLSTRTFDLTYYYITTEREEEEEEDMSFSLVENHVSSARIKILALVFRRFPRLLCEPGSQVEELFSTFAGM